MSTFIPAVISPPTEVETPIEPIVPLERPSLVATPSTILPVGDGPAAVPPTSVTVIQPAPAVPIIPPQPTSMTMPVSAATLLTPVTPQPVLPPSSSVPPPPPSTGPATVVPLMATTTPIMAARPAPVLQPIVPVPPVQVQPMMTTATTASPLANGRPIILVTGATGNVGGAVVDALLASGRYHIRALTRYPQSIKAVSLAQRGCEVVQGDMEDLPRMRQCARGCYGVFSMQNPVIGERFQPNREIVQGCNVADASKLEGVRHLVQLSWASADRAARDVPFFGSKWSIEQHVRGLELPFTVLRSTCLMENWLTGFYRVRRKRVSAYPSADVRDYYIAAADLGIFAELAFRQPELYLGKTMDIAGDYLNGHELAAVFTRVSPQNGPFKYKPLPRFLMRMAYPEFYLWAKWLDVNGHYPIDLNDLRARHPGLRTLEMWALEKGFQNKVLGESDCVIS